MKPLIALLVCGSLLAIQAQASEPSLNFGDLAITRGMSEESLRSELSPSHRIWCSDSEPGVDVVACTISAINGSGSHVQVLLQDGGVLTASQGYAVPPTAFDALMALYEVLSQLTTELDTCAVIRVSKGPPPQFSIALPEKYIAVFLHEHDQRQVTMNVGLRQNPTPDIQLEDCWPGIGDLAPPNNAFEPPAEPQLRRAAAQRGR